MFKKTLVKAATLLVLGSCIVPLAGAGMGRRDGGRPVSFSVTPAIALPGEQVSIELDMSSASSTDQVVQISTSTPWNWSSYPTEITVPAGQTSVTFTARVSLLGSGLITGNATSNGGSASFLLPIPLSK
jgi:hypothetical protein